MCVDPASMFIIASVASAGVSAYANIQRGNAEYAAGMYNANVAERNARAVEEERKNVQDAAAIERRRVGERMRGERGALVAKFANMGLDTEFGSPADLVGDVERAYDIDRSILGRNEITELKRLDQQEADYRSSAALSRAGAKSSRKAGLIGAAGSLLQGAATVSGRWIQPGSGNAFQPASVTAKPLSTSSSLRLATIGG